MTLFGEITLSRAYYHCPCCHRGYSPHDELFKLGTFALSPAARRVCSMAGVLCSFADAANKTLPELAGLRLSESTVERVTESAGRQLGELLQAGETFGPKKDWEFSRDADGKTVAYISADLTGVGMQGKDAVKAPGRMLALAMIYNLAVPARDGQPKKAGQVRYLGALKGGLAELGQPARNQAAQVGMERADRWVAIADGGSGIEDWLRVNFPRVEAVILDFYHASEHLHEWARAQYPQEPQSAERMGKAWSSWLKREGGEVVLGALRSLSEEAMPAGAREAYRELLVYFGNQVHRMDYPLYRSKGWQIGSGPVESACKLVGARLKGSGMRWGEDGADGVVRLRALFKSEKGQWSAFWATAA